MLQKILNTSTIRQSIIVFPATIVNGVLGLLFYVIVARILPAREFGILSLCITTMTLLSSVVDVGTDTGTIKFVGKEIGKDNTKALKFLKLALEIKIVAWVITMIVGFLLMPTVAQHLLNKPETTFYLRLSLLGVGSALLFSFATSALQAMQRFMSWAFINIFSNLSRLLTIVILGLFVSSLYLSLTIYILIPFVAFLTGLVLLPKFLNIHGEGVVAKDFFRYNKWVAIFIIIAAIASRLDTYITARFLTLEQVGIYSVAVVLSSVAIQIVSSIATIVAPKLVSFTTSAQAKAYLKKLQLFVVVLALGIVIVGSLLAIILIPLIYGQSYVQSIIPFIILLCAQAIFLISVPAHTSVMYYFSRPSLFVVINIINLMIVLLGGLFFIPTYGLIGAACVVLVGNIISFLIPGVWVLKQFKTI